MLLPDDRNKNSETSETPERSTRPPLNHKDVIRARRQNRLEEPTTDELPRLMGEKSNEKMAWRQVVQLREENHRLRSELAASNRNIETLHNSHRQEVEQYQNHLREIMDERNQLQEAYSMLEQDHQELYHSFRSAAEEKPNYGVADEGRTVEFSAAAVQATAFSAQNGPSLTHDEMKTVEFHVRQIEDKHTAEALYLMRQTQRKAMRLEQELAQERQHIMEQRQKLAQERNGVREQALLR
ncbi:MAG: hypothetical protein M3Z24_01290, partial [Chloroflexota bacterium]|nr:hypothetical protein [Chloroflexota bacterium]